VGDLRWLFPRQSDHICGSQHPGAVSCFDDLAGRNHHPRSRVCVACVRIEGWDLLEQELDHSSEIYLRADFLAKKRNLTMINGQRDIQAI
jgi:hypothetical protein